MAKEIIDIGTTPNDGTGDPLRTAFDKTNSNFTELYNSVSAFQADSTATSVGVLVQNFNTLLAKLIAAGLMASS